jgi:hypothetical protein
MRLEVTVHRSVGDRHGGRSYRAYGRAGVPAGHVSGLVNRFPDDLLHWPFTGMRPKKILKRGS